MKRQVTLDGTTINDSSDCYVIAELGNNHQGDVEVGLQMIDAAKACGANAVKLQKRNNQELLTAAMYAKPYDNQNSFGATYGEHRDFLELNEADYRTLRDYAAEQSIALFATAFDFSSVDFLEKMDTPFYKVASGDLTNTPLLKHIAQTKKPTIISTGGSSMDDVKRAYDTFMPINPNLIILQCTAAYPIYNYSDMNLRVIETYRDAFPELVIGLSDHENGISMGLIAYMLGARILEKHFTLNRAWPGADHAFSLTPSGLKRMIRDLKRTRQALGDGNKHPREPEAKPIMKMSKSIVAARDLPVNTILTDEDLALKCPGNGIPPYKWDTVVGRAVLVDIKRDEPFSPKELGAPK